MERERLERLKRARPASENEPPFNRPRGENIDDPTPAVSSSKSLSDSGLQYPDGTIKWTYVVRFPKESHHITIEEVLQKATLKAVVLSGFQVPLLSFSAHID
jgi:hypothetical protein